MKPGRNLPCPCGSGKKYKKCCLLNEEEPAQADMLMQAMNKLRGMTMDRKPHIKAYYRLRKLHGDIVDAMVAYDREGKFVQRITPAGAAEGQEGKDFQLLESHFDVSTEEGSQAFYDMLIYKVSPNLHTITEEFLEKHRYRNPGKIAFLQSMLASRLGLFEITAVDTAEGYVTLREVFTGDTYQITDIALSSGLHYDNMYLYTRIITHEGIAFGSGLNMVFSKSDPFIQDFIRHPPNGELVRLTTLYNRYISHKGGIKVLTNSL